MSLADALIEQNRKTIEREARLDKYGLLAPKETKGEKFLNYLVARALIRNPKLYSRTVAGQNRLYNMGREVACAPGGIAMLCDWWGRLMDVERLYIYKRLLDLAPKYSPDKIVITGNLAWDMEEQKLVTLKDGSFSTTY